MEGWMEKAGVMDLKILIHELQNVDVYVVSFCNIYTFVNHKKTALTL